MNDRQDRYSEILEKVPPSGIRRFFDLIIDNKDIISLGVGEPDFTTPWNIREFAFYNMEKGRTSYTSNKGLKELRQEISYYMADRFKVNYDIETEILVTVGVSEAIDISLRSVINAGDEVIVAEPCYVSYAPMVRLAGGVVVTLDTSKTDFVPTAQAIEKLITPKTKALIICYPNNPTGSTIKLPELKKIAKLVAKNKIWVFSDEVYSEITYVGEHTALASLPGMKEYTVTLNGFSKAFAMTGWRLGFVCAPPELMTRILKVHQYSALCAPIMSQYAGIEALRNCRADVNKMVRSYKQRRNLMLKGFRDMGLPVVEPDGAFYLFVDISSSGLSSEKFALKLIKEQKVAVVPGDVFGAGGQGYIRCCYATEVSLLKEALMRIKAFIKK